MSAIKFTKVVASGNDFVIIQNYNRDLSKLAKTLCDRKYGIGADGLLVLGKSSRADFKMRIFNPDGSEAEMCGNGLRCAALFSVKYSAFSVQKKKIESKAGILEAEVKGARVKVKMTQPKNIKLNIPLKINNRKIKVNFIDTGVPHTVIFVEGLDKIDAANLGRQVRFHQKFMPRGTNVDFVEVIDKNNIKIRTYERGVEDETLACGTGSVAAALITAYSLPLTACNQINVHTKSGEVLKVYFDKIGKNKFDVWLKGRAKKIYKGVYHV